MTGIPTPQRSRTKTADFSEIFRSSHGSRQLPKTVVAALPNTPSEEKQKSRRSMLPFLGRKKIERPFASSSALPRKSINTPSVSVGKELLNDVSSTADVSASDRRLPSTLPPLNVSPPSLGSKFAAHFSPLRSPTKTLKARYSSSYKSANTPPTHSSATLSLPVADGRGTSLESRSSSVNSRSTTPKPLLQPSAENTPPYEMLDDFSDLFTLPEHHAKPTKSAQKASTLSPVVVNAANGSEKCVQLSPVTPLTPASPTPPSTPRLQFPIPPSHFGLISVASEKASPQYSRESSIREPTTPSSKHSNSSLKLPAASPQHRFSICRERRSGRVTTAGVTSEDESDRARAFSHSGSDTDASRATDSSVRSRRGRHHSALPKASAMKRAAPLQRAPSSSEKLSSGPPPSAPLPSPPPSARSAPRLPISSLPVIPSTNSVPSNSTVHSPGIAPRPRANTLSATTSLSSARLAAWMAPRTNPQDKNTSADTQPPASEDDLRNALALQNRKYTQLQEYAVTITKKFEDEKASMAKTIQMLEREIRKKVREIEGLRWLVIHNGGADDIDAAANLARASLITLDDGDRFDAARAMDLTRGEAPSQSTRSPTVGSRRGLGLDYLDQPSPSSPSGASLEPPLPEFGIAASASSSHSSLSLPMLTPSTTSSLSAIPEQPSGKGEISRAERQKAKEERRASRALRRISSSSMSSATSGALVAHPPLPTEHTFDSQSSMENVLEKLRPFRNT
ncbi:hypothetical protein BDR05DRAFT_966956 [Suillus weaverae]|nr:hypothetical protein BDR05DRAFT_966956 [Suillus weaverae]